MRVRADQLDTGETASDQATDVGEPGSAVLGGDDVEAERLAEAVLVDADGVETQTLTVRRPRGTSPGARPG